MVNSNNNSLLEEEITIIQPHSKRSLISRIKEIKKYYQLLYFFIWRDIKVKYRQTIVGVIWVVLQPILTSVIFSVIFGNFLRLSSGSSPYIIFVFCALLPWNFFANSISKSSEGIIINRNLITKVYFPRLLLPASVILQNLVDFFISVLTLSIILFIFRIKISANLIYLPFIIFLVFVLALGIAFWLSALNVKYRDIRHIVPFLLQVWFFCSPVTYTVNLIPSKWLTIYSLNPMVGIIEAFRACFLGSGGYLSATLPISFLVSLLFFMSGFNYFIKAEKTFADII